MIYIYIYVNNSFLQQVYEPISVTFQKTVPKGWINLGNMHHKQIPNSILEGGLLEGGWGKECRRRPRICYINDLTGNYSLELTNFDLRTRELLEFGQYTTLLNGSWNFQDLFCFEFYTAQMSIY